MMPMLKWHHQNRADERVKELKSFSYSCMTLDHAYECSTLNIPNQATNDTIVILINDCIFSLYGPKLPIFLGTMCRTCHFMV
jgi:hypothetical protein